MLEHQDLLRAVSNQAERILHDHGTAPPGDSSDEPTVEGVHASWKKLSHEVAAKQAQLQEIISQGEPQVLFGFCVFDSVFCFFDFEKSYEVTLGVFTIADIC